MPVKLISGATETNYATIQEAVDNAVANDIIEVGAGTYDESVTVDVSDITIREAVGEEAIVDGQLGSGALGTFHLNSGVDNVVIEDLTILGLDDFDEPGLELAAIYFQGNHSGVEIRNNVIQARGDSAITGEYAALNDGIIIDGNEFTGATFDEGAGVPTFTTFGADQFSVENVPRQVVVFGPSSTNIQFTNNTVSTKTGGEDPGGTFRANTLVTIDGDGHIVTDNLFDGLSGLTSALRVRGDNKTITDNTFDQSQTGGIYQTGTVTALTDNTFEGDENDNLLFGSEGDDTINGFGGDDTIIATGGNDEIDGGADTDTYDLSFNNTTGAFVDLAAGIAFGGSETGSDNLTSIENVRGSAGVDDLRGSAVDNVFFASAEDDLIDGRGGSDTYDASAAASAISIDLATGTATGADFDTDDLTDIENAAGGAGNDTLVGTADANILSGNDGTDDFTGGGGDDTIDGGDGVDTANVDSVLDPANFTPGGSWSVDGNGDGTDLLTNVEIVIDSGGNRFLLVGSDGFASIGDALAMALDGDTVMVAPGDYAAESPITVDVDNLTVFGFAGADNIGFQMGTAANLTLDGEADIDVTGDGDAETIAGNAGSNVIDGAGGNDTISGGEGDDTLNGGGDTDTDTVLVDGNFADFEITAAGELVDNNVGDGDLGTDLLTGVEILQFNDATVRIVGVGGAYATIGDAIAAADPGDIIAVVEGTYNEQVDVTTSVTIQGFGNVVIEGPGKGTGRGIEIFADDVNLVNLTVQSFDHGISLDNGFSNVTIDDVTATNNDVGMRTASSVQFDGITVTNSHFDGNDYGFYFANDGGNSRIQNLSVSDTTFDNNLNAAVYGETLETASFTNIQAIGSATGSANGVVFDFWTGYPTTFSDISFDGFTIDNSGGDAASAAFRFNTFGAATDATGIEILNGSVLNVARVLRTTEPDSAFTISNVDLTAALDGATFGGPDGRVFDAVTSVIEGDYGDDTLSGDRFSPDDDDVIYGDFYDTFNGDAFDAFFLSFGAPTVDAGNDSLSGGGGNDVVFGGGGNDTIEGETGDDELIGEIGDDLLIGGEGDDLIDGGADFDTVRYAGSFTDFTVSDGSFVFTDTVGAEGEDTLMGVETVEFLGDGTTVLLVGSDSEYATIQAAIDAASDGDVIMVGSGTYAEDVTLDKAISLIGVANGSAPVIEGSNVGLSISGSLAGMDISVSGFEFTGANIGIRVESGTELANLFLDDLNIHDNSNQGFRTAGDTPAVENIEITNSSFADNGQGGANGSADLLLWEYLGDALIQDVDFTSSKALGDAQSSKGDNAIQIIGREPDTYDVTEPVGTVVLDGVTTNGSYHKPHLQIQGYSDLDGLTFIDVELNGSSNWGDLLFIDPISTSGTDTQGAPGLPGYYEGEGGDTFLDLSDITINNTSGPKAPDPYFGTAGFDARVRGSDGNDEILGTNADDLLNDLAEGPTDYGGNDEVFGYGGNDGLIGLNGDNTLHGGLGDDNYLVDSTDTVDESVGEGADSVFATEDYALDAGSEVENLTAFAPAAVNLTGNEFAQTITGNDADNVLIGGGGDDELIGGLGDDTLDASEGEDTVDGGDDTDVAVIADNGGVPLDFGDVDLTGFNATDGVDNEKVVIDGREVTLTDVEVLEVTNTGSSTFIVSDGLSLQDAIDEAEEGDTIYLAAGTYGPVTISTDDLTLQAVENGVIIQGAGVNQGSAIRIETGVEGVTVDGNGFDLTIETMAGDLAAIYAVGDNDDITVQNATLNGGTGSAFLAGGSGGEGLTNSLIDGNQINGDGPNPIFYVNGLISNGVSADNVDITDNTFTGGANAGLIAGTEATNSDITGNTFQGMSSYAQLELWQPGNTVESNEFFADGDTAIADSGSDYDEETLADDNDFDAGAVYIEGKDNVYTSIQAAIDAAEANDVIHVGPGTYEEVLTIATEGLSIVAEAGAILMGDLAASIPAWDQNDPLNDFFEANHPAYSGSNGITIEADEVSISGLTIREFRNGVELGNTDGTSISGTTFIDNVNGIRKGTAQQVTNLDVSGNDFSQGIYGMTIYAASNGDGSFDGITMDNNSFSALSEKGLYFEQLSGASLTGNEFSDVGNYGRVSPPFGGTDGEFGQAIDINLKYETYENVTFTDTSITDSGNSTGGGSPGAFGGAIGIKTRDDAPSYDGSPASFVGAITFDGLTIDGTSTGVRVGEPGKDNLGPDVVLTDFKISNATGTDVENATDPAAGGTTTITLEETQATLDASLSQASVIVNGNELINILTTGSGDDVLAGGLGDDELDGGAGIDAAVVDAALTVADLTPTASWEVDGGAQGVDHLENIEIVIDSGGNRFLLVGSGGFGSVTAALDAAEPGDTVIVPAGDYTAESPVTVDVDDLTIHAVAGALRLSFQLGLANSITLDGAADIDVFGDGDAENIIGNDGANTINGGGGNDTLNGGGGTDTVDYLGSANGVTVSLASGVALGGASAGNDLLSNFENIRGSAFDDVLVGNGASNTFFATSGEDDIDGGNGSDTYDASAATDAVFALLNLGTISSISFGIDSVTSVENVIGGDGDDNFQGDEFANSLKGNDGNDTLDGGDGDDELVGNQGEDELLGGLGNDRLLAGTEDDTLFGDEGDDTLFGGGGNDSLDGNAGFDFLDAGNGADTLSGGVGNDTLLGQAGADELFGDGGDDTLEGGSGSDTLDGGTDNDSLLGGAGTDTLYGNGGDDIIRGQGEDDVLYGDGGRDKLFGGQGDDNIFGGTGWDRLEGAKGSDTLTGEEGRDTLSGGQGDDRFVFRDGDNADTIVDFQDGVDLIDLSQHANANDFGDISSSQIGADLLVMFDADDSVLLENFDQANLDDSDFFFGP